MAASLSQSHQFQQEQVSALSLWSNRIYHGRSSLSLKVSLKAWEQSHLQISFTPFTRTGFQRQEGCWYMVIKIWT